MTAMLGYADLMRARPDYAETQREAAGYIYHETQRLENLSRSPVSYTHLASFAIQSILLGLNFYLPTFWRWIHSPVSSTHLDVYKRQCH